MVQKTYINAGSVDCQSSAPISPQLTIRLISLYRLRTEQPNSLFVLLKKLRVSAIAFYIFLPPFYPQTAPEDIFFVCQILHSFPPQDIALYSKLSRLKLLPQYNGASTSYSPGTDLQFPPKTKTWSHGDMKLEVVFRISFLLRGSEARPETAFWQRTLQIPIHPKLYKLFFQVFSWVHAGITTDCCINISSWLYVRVPLFLLYM